MIPRVAVAADLDGAALRIEPQEPRPQPRFCVVNGTLVYSREIHGKPYSWLINAVRRLVAPVYLAEIFCAVAEAPREDL